LSQERATICPYCSHENVALQVYCSHCERPLRREAPSPRKRKRNTKVILEPAPYLRVLGAQLIDLLTLGIVGIAAALVRTLFVEPAFVRPSGNPLEWVINIVDAYPQGLSTGLVIAALYGVTSSLAFGLHGGRSPGRIGTQTIMVSMAGHRLTLRRVATRTAMLPLSLLCCGAGFFWAVLDPYHRTWHDLAAGTVLVDRRIRLPKRHQKQGMRRPASSSAAQSS
jgi:uncharacterized RDD family membrane protein YckC